MAEIFTLKALEDYARESQMFLKLRTRLLEQVKAAGAESNSIIALHGTEPCIINDSDTEYELFYEAFSFNITGLKDLSCYIIIEIDSGQVHIFVPPFDDVIKAFLLPSTPEAINETYGYNAYYHNELGQVLNRINPSCVYLNKGTNTDSGVSTPCSYLNVPELASYKKDEDLLYKVFAKARSVKIDEEIEIMKRVIKASSEAHIEVMKHCRPGLMEYSLAGVFRGYISTNYGFQYSFKPISASGKTAAVLHYPYMDKRIEDGTIMLCDMGAYGYGYCSDIACSFPANGKFTEKQANIYNIVLKANRAVIQTMRPGMDWTDMHLLAEKVIIEGLVDIGVLKGNTEEIQRKRIGAIFFPHGLGHFLGQDTHDVGGYICGHSRSTEPGIKCLRTRRNLEKNMIITVEPGCYFIDFAIEQGLANPDFQEHFGEKLSEYRDFGGVRIEDDVLVTENGGEILTDVPRTVAQIEALMAGQDWRSV